MRTGLLRVALGLGERVLDRMRKAEHRWSRREVADSPFYFAPSDYHRHLLKNTNPALGFRGGDVAAWQQPLREKIQELLGDLAGDDCSLSVRPLWRRDHPLGSIEKVVFASEPHCDVPAYVCLPRDAQPPYSFVICLQGHNSGMHRSIGVQRYDESKPLAVEGDRDFAVQAMARGLAALCIEQRSLGERRELRQERVAPHGCHDSSMHALLLGKTLLGERLHDVDRAIDYLESRGDAHPGRVGVMGNSGGGCVSLFAAALLPRVALAMPSCCFCTFRDSIMAIPHCVDNYVPGLLKVAEMSDVAGLCVPKPLVVVAGERDDLFPIRGVRKAFEDLRGIYAAAGATDRCHLVVGSGGHRFYADRAWPVYLEAITKLPGG